MAKIEYKCNFCNNSVFRYESAKIKVAYCNRECKNNFQKTLTGDRNPLTGRAGLFGEDNPNYGNKWSQHQKNVASDRSTTWHENDDGSWLEKNRNRVWTDVGKASLAAAVSKRMTGTSRSHTDEQKEHIGVKSAEKFTPEYKLKFRKTMEDRGYWIPIKLKDSYAIYCNSANWIERMFDLCDDTILKENGIFGNGGILVRDHRYGRRSGYKNKVYPELLRHPANCAFITHTANVTKGKTKKRHIINT